MLTKEQIIKTIENSPFTQKTIFSAYQVTQYFAKIGIDEHTMKAIKPIYMAHARERLKKHLERVKEVQKNKPVKRKKEKPETIYKGVFRCPECNGFLIKESICPNCKEGQSGKKIRFTCENSPECNFFEDI